MYQVLVQVVIHLTAAAEAARPAKGQCVSPRLAGEVPVAGLQASAQGQAAAQSNDDRAAKRGREGGGTGGSGQLRRRVNVEGGQLAQSQRVLRGHTPAAGVGKRSVEAEASDERRSKGRRGGSGAEQQSQTQVAVQPAGGGADLQAGAAVPKRALTTLRGDGRQVKSRRVSPRYWRE